MSKDINTVAVSGRVTRDPEVRETSGGTKVIMFSVACNDRRKSQQTGQWEDVASFFDVVLFGAQADWLARDLHKGKYVHVQGRMRQSTWERDGQRRSKVEVVADEVCYERPPRQQGQQQYQPQQQYRPQQQYQPQQAPQGYRQQEPQQQDDIPF